MFDDLEISEDKTRLEVGRIHAYLAGESYWAKDRPRELTELAIASSMCLGAYAGGRQVAFGRVVTDHVALAWIADLFVFEEARGHGIGTAMMRAIVDHPALQSAKRMSLITLDAHHVYEPFGFGPPAHPEMWMDRPRPGGPPVDRAG
ncbi:MAG: GNAT family N-acetyltransferase [Solirubrobacteraceae bacterium]|nr:GNAT family N-acetyltransferase [Solirubrobacteraceae bacterium]